MDCGIPFCHQGCPLGNIIPEWNDLVWRDDWDGAIDRLHATNNFPEFTGRLCPAPCETACVLGINQDPVTIKNVEVSIIDRAWGSGYVRPQPPEWLSGKTVAVIGSGPAGLAAAQQLTRAGHTVAVYERADKIGGLLRYGIPEFKMEKKHLDRRLDQMRREGTVFRAGVDVGGDLTGDKLLDRYDAVVLAMGATAARDLPGPGPRARRASTRRWSSCRRPTASRSARPRPPTAGPDHGDRQGRRHHRRRRHRRRLPRHVDPPGRPLDHAAGDHAAARRGPARGPAVADVPDDLPGLLGPRGGRRAGLRRVDAGVRRRRRRQRRVRCGWSRSTRSSSPSRAPSARSRPSWCCSRWASPVRSRPRARLIEQLGVDLDERGNVARDASYAASVPGVFVAGDAGRGQSLIVWAIAEGRSAAAAVDAYLTGSTTLPAPIKPHERPLVV